MATVLASIRKVNTHTGSKAGFTLIEITIAFTILALIVLLLGMSMRLGLKSVEKGENRIGAMERTRASFQLINSQLQSFVPLMYNDLGNKKYYFKGDEKSITFLTTVSIWGRHYGLILATYTVENKDGNHYLVAEEESLYSKESRTTVLLSGFKDISFNYLVKKATATESEWTQDIDYSDVAPDVVNLSVENKDIQVDLEIPLRSKMSTTQQNQQTNANILNLFQSATMGNFK
ncbi:MAG: prepilin-type N-terminal cleavage/methylation domain-containing protein [Nitrospirae bacterium]|nr:prepilin-type N-terminal cleavage/methylation domain-containing protein [Nitrospirota bacterium]